MTNQEVKQTIEQKNEQNIPSQRAKLEEINQKKEEWFRKKEELNKQIGELITSLKKLNPEIDEAKKKERELRQKRDENNRKFLEFLDKSKELVRDKKLLEEKFGHGATSEKIKSKIEKLEYTIETEVFSMTKEKKVMDQIRGFKKVLAETSSSGDYRAQMQEISPIITSAKEEADKAHKELRELQKENRKKFKEYMINSRKVNQLKKEQREAFKNFVTYKTEFLKLNAELRAQMPTSSQMHHKKKERKYQQHHDIRRVQEDFIDNARLIENKVKEVEQKIKDKKKLTTQDILAMQGKKN